MRLTSLVIKTRKKFIAKMNTLQSPKFEELIKDDFRKYIFLLDRLGVKGSEYAAR
jgi:hypothetical protein